MQTNEQGDMRTVRITDEDALDKLVELEGIEWLREQERRRRPDSFFGWRNTYRAYMELPDEERQYVELSDMVDREPVLYGNGGYHRWAVLTTGELVLLGWSAPEPNREKARKLGFQVR